METNVMETETEDLCQSFELSLGELRSGRQLKQVTSSIENFLTNQMVRLESALERCEQAENQDQILQRMIHEFEKQKSDWEQMRVAEEKRLYEAGQKLIRSWNRLENERNILGFDKCSHESMNGNE